MLKAYSNSTTTGSSNTFIPESFDAIDYLDEDFIENYVQELDMVYTKVALEYQMKVRKELADDPEWSEVAQDFTVLYSSEDNSFVMGFATTEEEYINKVQYGGPYDPPNPKLSMLLLEAEADIEELINRRPL
jgi:hypothetical protein